MKKHTDTTIDWRTFFGRMADLMDCAGDPGTATRFKAAVPDLFHDKVNDLDSLLEPSLEQEIADELTGAFRHDIQPSALLLPEMAARRGVDPDVIAVSEAPEAETARAVCDGCTLAGDCWLAMRHPGEKQTLSAVTKRCPNATRLRDMAAAA